MSVLDVTIVPYLGFLLVIALAGFVAVTSRAQVSKLTAQLAEAQLALEGANNRLEQAKTRVALLSNTDPVTGLLVRHVVVERFQLTLALARAQHTAFGVVLLQLTDFEHLADRHGREIADKLLTAVAERLITATHETETVGRVREHEFAILVPVLAHPDDIEDVANRLRDTLLPSFVLPGMIDTFRLSVHVGGAAYPRDGEDWTTLLKSVDERLRSSRMLLT